MIPLLIHQMGRVGSTSIYNAVKNLPEFDVYHTHMLNEKSLDDFISERVTEKLKIPDHVSDSQKVISSFLQTEEPIKIVSLVRDPMARNVSAFFNNLDLFGFRSVQSRKEAGADELLQHFENYDHMIPIRWFSVEFRDVFGFSVFDTPFDFETKTLTATHKNISVLILRLEDDDDMKIKALEKFLGVTNLSLSQDNEGGRKFGEAYGQFKSIFTPNSELVDMLYNSKLVEHFYSPKEAASMKAGWKTAEPTELCEQDVSPPTSSSSSS